MRSQPNYFEVLVTVVVVAVVIVVAVLPYQKGFPK